MCIFHLGLCRCKNHPRAFWTLGFDVLLVILLGLFANSCASDDLSCSGGIEGGEGGRLPVGTWKGRQTDENCDGAPESCASVSLEADGRLREALDDGCDGSVDFCAYFTRNAHGNTLRAEYDFDCDGSVDESASSWQYSYDQDGRLIEKVDDGDDLPPRCHYYARYPNGNLSREQEDWGCDGVVDSCTSYTYDANGGRLTMQHDFDCSCRYVQTTCYLSTYDTVGNQVTRNQDVDCDGVADSCLSFLY